MKYWLAALTLPDRTNIFHFLPYQTGRTDPSNRLFQKQQRTELEFGRPRVIWSKESVFRAAKEVADLEHEEAAGRNPVVEHVEH